MAIDIERARRGFKNFLHINKGKLSARKLSAAAGLSSSAATQFTSGNSQSPKMSTLLAYAAGATEILGRAVTVAEMIDQDPEISEIPITSFVGAGDEVTPIDGDEPIGYAPAPPDYDATEVTEVRGDSMRPLYRDGDWLYHSRIDADPIRFRDDIAVVQVKNGPRYVKLILPGSKKGRFHLVSINPAYPVREDQALLWIAPIVWVRKKRHPLR